jgi:hypothetical protein
VVKVSGDWGTATNREFQIGLLAGIPGLGMKRAKAIVEHFDGRYELINYVDFLRSYPLPVEEPAADEPDLVPA